MSAKYQAFLNWLTTRGSTKEEFERELVHYYMTIDKFEYKLEVSWDLSFDVVYSSRREFFSFANSIKGYDYWVGIFNIPNVTTSKLLTPFLPQGITNEEIFRLFLKKHRKYKAVISCKVSSENPYGLNGSYHVNRMHIILNQFNLSSAWKDLVRKFNLSGFVAIHKV